MFSGSYDMLDGKFYKYADVIRSDFNEITNPRIINQLKMKLRNHKFFIRIADGRIPCDSIFIKKFVTQIEELEIESKNIKRNEMDELFDFLLRFNIHVCFI